MAKQYFRDDSTWSVADADHKFLNGEADYAAPELAWWEWDEQSRTLTISCPYKSGMVTSYEYPGDDYSWACQIVLATATDPEGLEAIFFIKGWGHSITVVTPYGSNPSFELGIGVSLPQPVAPPVIGDQPEISQGGGLSELVIAWYEPVEVVLHG